MHTSTAVGLEYFDVPHPAVVYNSTRMGRRFEGSGQGGVRASWDDGRARWEQGRWKVNSSVEGKLDGCPDMGLLGMTRFG